MAALSELKAMSVIVVIASMLSVHSLGGSVQASSGWADVEALLMDYGTPSMIPKKTSSDDLALRGQSLVQQDDAATNGPPMQKWSNNRFPVAQFLIGGRHRCASVLCALPDIAILAIQIRKHNQDSLVGAATGWDHTFSKHHFDCNGCCGVVLDISTLGLG